MTQLAVNGRFRLGPQTGVQRVAAELIARLGLASAELAPASGGTGMRGHLWEQVALPPRLHGRPLWSPCNTGPVAVAAQVVTLHDAAIFDHPEWFSRAFVQTYRLLWPALARRVRRIVTVSDYSADRLSAALGLPRDRIEVIYNGASAHFQPVGADEIAAVAPRYGVAPGRYFATLSTIEPRKNLPLVLDAWERTRGQLPADMRLLLLGGGGASHIFAAQDQGGVAKTGMATDRLLRSGFVPDADLPALLGGACGLLYPSRYEGFGLPVLEAMACGTPAVTTRLTSLPEVGGDAVLYVDPDDAGALATTIRRLAESAALRDELSQAGLEQARRFSWDRSAAQMAEILHRDLGVTLPAV